MLAEISSFLDRAYSSCVNVCPSLDRNQELLPSYGIGLPLFAFTMCLLSMINFVPSHRPLDLTRPYCKLFTFSAPSVVRLYVSVVSVRSLLCVAVIFSLGSWCSI